MMITLNCHVLGDQPNDIFPVEIDTSKVAESLKLAIKEAKRPRFDHVDTDELDLWKVSVPLASLEEKVEELMLTDGGLLWFNEKLTKAFWNGVENEHLHIVVTAPPPSGILLPPTRLPLFEVRRQFYKNGSSRVRLGQAGPEEFANIQQDDAISYLCCRPSQRQHSIPLTLLDSAFGAFVDGCKNITPTAKDYAAAAGLKQAMCDFYDKEWTYPFDVSLVFKAFGMDIDIGSIYGPAHRAYGYIENNNRLALILEVVHEAGSPDGADPSLKLLLDYDTFCQKFGHWRDITSCHPCFAVILAGPFIIFAGCAMTERSTFEMFSSLSAYFHHADDNGYNALARHLAALKAGVTALLTRYDGPISRPNRSLVSASSRQVQQVFPYPNTFAFLGNADKELVAFSYNGTIEGGRLLFSGRTEKGGPICIKFVRRYGVDVHLWCSEQGFAPKLIAYEKLHDGWYMVIMEFLDESWVELDPMEHYPEDLKGSVHSSIAALHRNGMVHGDICRKNIMVKRGEARFMLVDFDWAGLANTVKYPPFMTQDSTFARPAGVDDCKPILSEHDVSMLERLF